MSPRRHLDLPLLPAPLIGRDAVIAEIRRRLADRAARMVTLTGPPGVGKTSLALSVAHDLADEFRFGARLIDLAPIDDPALVPVAIADELGVRRSGDRPLWDQIVRFIRDRRLLLLVDNFEQVVTAAPMVASLLAGCPNLTVLVTSRVPLRIRWEVELPIGPLALPPPERSTGVTTLATVPSVALFVTRARAVSPGFALTRENAALVGEICTALDGLPLAIELAAARVRSLSVADLHTSLIGLSGSGSSGKSLVAPLDLLAAGPRDLTERQQSLRRAIAWSYDLLDPAAQTLLRRLAVLVGGATFEAVESVCQGSWETIATLVEHSLVRYEQPVVRAVSGRVAEPRVRLLETVRQFGIEQLIASGEWDAIGQRHGAFFRDLAEQAEPELLGPRQADWLDRLSEDRDNLRAAVRRAVASGDVETVLRLGSALIRFWRLRGDAADARERVEGILALASTAPPLPATIKAFAGAADLARVVGDYAAAESLYERSLAVARELGDQRGAAMALCELCRFATSRGSYTEARGHGDGSLEMFLALGDLTGQATVLRELGMVNYYEGDMSQARTLLERAWTLGRELRDRRVIADAAFSLAVTYHVSGELAAARLLYEEAHELDRVLGHRAGLGSVLNNLGNVATLQGDFAVARRLLGNSIAVSREVGDRRRQAFTLSAIAGLAAALDEPERALRFDAAGIAVVAALGARLGPPMRALYDDQLGSALTALGEPRASAVRAAGRELTLEQAVDEALAWLSDDAGTLPVALEPVGALSEGPSSATAPERVPAVPAPSEPVPAIPAAPGPGVLTRRERDVAILLGHGLTTNREIAAALVITEGTAATYVQRVLNRLDLRTRAQVAAWAAGHLLEAGPLDS